MTSLGIAWSHAALAKRARAWGVLVGALALTSTTHAQPSPAAQVQVTVTVEGLFGEGTILSDSYVPIVVTLESRVARDLRGEVELVLEGYDQQRGRHVTHVDLPAGARRQVVMMVFTDSASSTLTARYVAEGRGLGVGHASYAYTAGGRSVVVLGDPPRLRGALLELDVEEATPHGPRQLRTVVGVVRFDPASADPMLPTEVVGWSSVRVLVASAPVLARASEPQRAALADWLRAGGRLLVLPRVARDLADPWLRALAGEVEVGPPSDAPRALVPDRGERFELACSEGQRVESFGCSARVGFGRVYLASYDAASPAAIETGVPRELVRSVYGALEIGPPAYVLGRHGDTLESSYHYGSLEGLASLRAALDPNESFRPALLLVALALLLYVIVVGPLNFRWVQKKNRPTLALLTTPLAAVGCLAVLLVVGYLGKGVTTRFRRVEVVEAVEGERRGPARRYTGLYVTRPGSFDLPGTSPGEAAHRIEGGGARGPVHRHEGDRVRLADFRAGLWETIFLREDRMVELSGTVTFGRDGRRLSTVRNESPHPLRHAFVVEGSGAVYVVGEVPAGGRADIPRTSSTAIVAYDPSSSVRALGEALGIDSGERGYLHGVLRTSGIRPGNVSPSDVPVLFAYAPTETAAIGNRFAPEADHRWLRIVPRLRGEPVAPAPPPGDPDEALRSVDGSSGRLVEEEEAPEQEAPQQGVREPEPEDAPEPPAEVTL